MKKFTLLIILMLGLILSFACAPKKTDHFLPAESAVAVAGFSQPIHRWQMINNHVVIGAKRFDPDIFKMLDSDLGALLSGNNYHIVAPSIVQQCVSVTPHGTDPGDAFHYWVSVARCVPADFILVPFVFEWQERVGGDWGVDEPARVTIELNLIDLSELRLSHFKFDERQQSLTENLLGAGRFFQRGGKWISARALAREGLEQGVRELGL
ncbi:hypothetical protein [Desulfonatronovibrio magnus]|uniref:hypothetical protein n=1 Tax=Desulfonatronovibrio magnus TaxID=698827 RepID=UPI0005EBA5F6|nr:hypothetical protein [Desulfonatronovibrio magnus]